MATVKREKMIYEDDVGYDDEIEIKIDIKREEGENFGRVEDDDGDGGGKEEEGIEDEVVDVPVTSTSADPHGRRPSLKRKVKATQVEEQPRNAKKLKTASPTKMTSKAKTKKTKKSVNPPPSLTSTSTSSTSSAKKGEATSQVERDAQTASDAQTAMDMLRAELPQVHNKFHSLSQDALAVNNKIVTLGRKWKEAMGIDTQNVKKVKSALPKVKTPNGLQKEEEKMSYSYVLNKLTKLGFVWTAEDDTALVEGINEYGLDFGRIKAEAGARLGGRKAQALYEHFRKYHPDRFEELREVTPMNHGCCLVRGGRRSAEEGGIDARLRLRENNVLVNEAGEDRTLNAVQKRKYTLNLA